jgi:hypothetical protein
MNAIVLVALKRPYAARERLRSEDPTLRKGYVRQFVDRIEVDDHEIRIIGPAANLVGGVLGSGRATASGVPSFGQGWWRGQSAANPSPPHFPAIREKYRDLPRQQPLLERAIAGKVPNYEPFRLAPRADKFVLEQGNEQATTGKLRVSSRDICIGQSWSTLSKYLRMSASSAQFTGSVVMASRTARRA